MNVLFGVQETLDGSTKFTCRCTVEVSETVTPDEKAVITEPQLVRRLKDKLANELLLEAIMLDGELSE